MLVPRPARLIAAVFCLAAWAAAPAARAAEDTPAVAEIRAVIAEKGRASVIVQMAMASAPEFENSNGVRAPQVEDTLSRARVQAMITRQRLRVAETRSTMRAALASDGIAMEQDYENLPLFVTTVDETRLGRLLANPGVAAVFPNKARRARPQAMTPAVAGVTRYEPVFLPGAAPDGDGTDPLAAPLLSSSTVAMNATAAWAKGATGAGQAVAILDDGIHRGHDMFAGKIVSEACYSPAFGSGEQSLCPSGTSSTAVNSASNCNAHADACDHGSHVAGIAAGNDTTGSFTLRGVAYNAGLIPIQVFSIINDNGADACDGEAPCLLSYTSAQLSGLNRVITLANTFNIAAANLSLGGDPQGTACNGSPLKPAIDTLRALGILTTIAAGNEGQVGKVSDPACITTAVTVSSVNNAGAPHTAVNHSAQVDVLAPGVSIRSAGQSNTYVFASGTSMAAPHAAGAIALLKSAKPSATATEIEDALKNGGVPTTLPSWSWSTPRIDVDAALTLLTGGSGPSAAPAGTAVIGVFASSNPDGTSYLRFFNAATSAGTLTAAIYDENTGELAATWTKTVPGLASLQYAMAVIEQEASPPLSPTAANASYALYVDATFSGHVQHVFWDPVSAALTNASGCAGGVSSDGSYFINVHTSLIPDYPAYLLVHNTGTAAAKPSFSVRHAATGGFVGNFSLSTDIPPLATGLVFLGDILEGVFGQPPQNGQYHLNIIMNPSFTGFAQHIVDNKIARVFTNMTAKCDF